MMKRMMMRLIIYHEQGSIRDHESPVSSFCAKQPCAKPSIFITSYHQPWMTMMTMRTMMIMMTMMNMRIIMAMMILCKAVQCKTIYIHHIISATFNDLNFDQKHDPPHIITMQ